MQQRLFEITRLLTQQANTTAGELAERFGVSRRTIYRDIDALSSAGIPVYAEKGRGGGIRLLPGFVIDKSLFSKDEQAQLTAHFNSLSALGTPDTEAALEKLAALFGRSEAWLEVDFAPWGDNGSTRHMLRSLRDAILRRQVLRFGYMGAGGQQSQREVEPWRVHFRGQGWYLHAFCRSRGDWRFFKLNRIQNLHPTGEFFSPRQPPEPAPAATMPTTSIAVCMKLAPSMAFRALEEFPPEALTHHEDGSVTAEFEFPDTGNWHVGYILSFGADCEILGPPALRQEIAAELQRALGHYRD